MFKKHEQIFKYYKIWHFWPLLKKDKLRKSDNPLFLKPSFLHPFGLLAGFVTLNSSFSEGGVGGPRSPGIISTPGPAMPASGRRSWWPWPSGGSPGQVWGSRFGEVWYSLAPWGVLAESLKLPEPSATLLNATAIALQIPFYQPFSQSVAQRLLASATPGE